MYAGNCFFHPKRYLSIFECLLVFRDRLFSSAQLVHDFQIRTCEPYSRQHQHHLFRMIYLDLFSIMATLLNDLQRFVNSSSVTGRTFEVSLKFSEVSYLKLALLR